MTFLTQTWQMGGRLVGSLSYRRCPSVCHAIPDFLSDQAAAGILSTILDQEKSFCPLKGNRNFLRLPEPIPLPATFGEKLQEALPVIQNTLGIDLGRVNVELYVHAYNDGTHFDRHSDAYGGGNWKRRISCIYYLHREPRAFTGGELVVYPPRGRPSSKQPRHNSLVYFPSNLIHEVLPVTCRSGRFADSRFAINVWIM